MMEQGSSYPNPIFTRAINDQRVQAMELAKYPSFVEQRELAQQAYEKLKPFLERNDKKEILRALGQSIRNGNVEEVAFLASIAIKEGDDPDWASIVIDSFSDNLKCADLTPQTIGDLQRMLGTTRKRHTNSLSMIKTLDSFGFFTAPSKPIYTLNGAIFYGGYLSFKAFRKTLNKDLFEEKNLYEKIALEQAQINGKVIEYILEKKEVRRFLDNGKCLEHKKEMQSWIATAMLNASKNASIGEPLFHKILTLGKKILCLTSDLAQVQESLRDSLKKKDLDDVPIDRRPKLEKILDYFKKR